MFVGQEYRRILWHIKAIYWKKKKEDKITFKVFLTIFFYQVYIINIEF